MNLVLQVIQRISSLDVKIAFGLEEAWYTLNGNANS
jgi:hypothetical protein